MTLSALSHFKFKNFNLNLFITVLLFGFIGVLCGYIVSTIFPKLETVLYDWQVSIRTPSAVDPSIVIITLDEHDSASCGNGRWNSSEIAMLVSALHQAGAAVIGPSVRIGIPNPPECGDVLGNAQLLEATKQAGNVVYPSFVQPLFANEARTTGQFILTPDDDGIFRELSSSQMENGMKHWPFGLAIVSAYNSGNSLRPPEHGLVSFVGQWADQPFPTYTFTQLFDLVQRGQDVKLSTLVQNKIVLIFPVIPSTENLDTPLEVSAPLGFVHANILNTALMNSWFHKPSWITWFLNILCILFAMAFIVSWGSGRLRWGILGIVIVSYLSGNTILFVYTETVWPHMNSIITIASALIGIIVWTKYEVQKNIRHQIEEVSGQLAAMQENLVKKEMVVEQLEEDLLEAKGEAQATSQKYDRLSTSDDTIRNQLQKAEAEAEDARQKLQGLQRELMQLRKFSPVLTVDTEHTDNPDQQQLQKEAEAFGIVTCSQVLLKTFQELQKAANTDCPILILGETGTGKELFAQAAHQLSDRSQGPYVSVNMAAIRPELFESELFGHVKGAFTGAISRRGFLESADRGSVFLDEIGELPLDLQAKLLRVLENGTFYRVGQSTPTQVNVRIIAATNRDLSQAVKDGAYREDLYYRLRSLVFKLPPLRERGKEDLRLLVQRIIADLSPCDERKSVHLTQGAMETIQAYTWPGNVRELRQTLAQAVTLATGSSITEHDLRLPQNEMRKNQLESELLELKIQKHGGKDEMTRREDAFVLSTLQQHGFDMQATARALQWDRSTVTQRLKGLGFQALVDHAGDVHRAAVAIAENPSLEKIVELKLSEYYKNLLSSIQQSESEEQAISDCRKRMRNIPERHFPAIKTLIRKHFANSAS